MREAPRPGVTLTEPERRAACLGAEVVRRAPPSGYRDRVLRNLTAACVHRDGPLAPDQLEAVWVAAVTVFRQPDSLARREVVAGLGAILRRSGWGGVEVALQHRHYRV
jgi:hypothetical protein